MSRTDNEDMAMTRRMFRRLSILLAALLVLVAPAAHAQTPPAGDSYLAPVTVKLNSSKTIKHIELATLNTPPVEAVSCDANGSSDHSIWFTFTLPASAIVDIDANGSLLNTEDGTTTQLVMTLYSPTGIGSTETECLYQNKPRMVDMGLTAGIYTVRLASDILNRELIAPSQYRLSVRVRYLGQFLVDGSFSEVPLAPQWKIKKAGNPPQVVHACAAQCDVAFNGRANARLQQTIRLDSSQLKFKAGDYFAASAYVSGTTAAGADIKITLTLTYSDGTPPSTASVVDHVIQTNLDGSAATGGIAVEIRSPALKTVKYTIGSTSTADTFRVRGTTVSLAAGTSVRVASILPLPAQP
jgi:hypothetical protein